MIDDKSDRRRASRDEKSYLRRLVVSAKPALALSASLSTISSMLWLVQAWLIAQTIGSLVVDPTNGISILSAASFLLLGVLRCVLSWTSLRRASDAASDAMRLVRNKVVQAVTGWAPLAGDRPSGGGAAALHAEVVDALEPYLLRFEPARIRLMIVTPIILAVVAWNSWFVALILLISGPLVPFFMSLIGMAAQAASNRQFDRLISFNAHLADRLRGLTDVRFLQAERAALDQVSRHAETLRDATLAVLRIAFLSSAVLEIVAAFSVALVAIYVGFELLGYFSFGAYAGGLTPAAGLFVLMLAPEFFLPLREYAAAYHDRAGATAAAATLRPILDRPAPRRRIDWGRQTPAESGSGAIDIRDVSFRYPGATGEVFRRFDLKIPAGGHVLLTGPSGSGKTTLLALLGGLLAPDYGSVGRGRREAASLRDGATAWMGQRPHFLRTTLRNNLKLGRSDLTDADLHRAIDKAGVKEVLESLPLGLSTVIGEGGQGISGGEAQRFALARAYLAGGDLMLADEPTAHLDLATAEEVARRLLLVAEGRTLVVASHDERIYRFFTGRVDLGRSVLAA